MSRDAKFLILLAATAVITFALTVYVLETLLAEAEFVQVVITDPVPPWMIAQLQEEARKITEEAPGHEAE